MASSADIQDDARVPYGPLDVRPPAAQIGDKALWVGPDVGQALYQVQSGNWARVGLAWRGAWDPDASYGAGDLVRGAGRLYVATSRSEPAGPTLARADTFARDPQSGWGTASDGHAWAVLNIDNGLDSISEQRGLASSDVSDNIDLLGLGAALDTASVEMLVRWQVTLSVDGTDGGAAGLCAADASKLVLVAPLLSGALFLRVATQTTTITPGWAGGDADHAYWTRWRHVAGVLSVRTWRDGEDEPAAWDQVWASGQTIAAGIVTLFNLGNNASTTVAFDHLSAWTLTPPPAETTAAWDLLAGP